MRSSNSGSMLLRDACLPSSGFPGLLALDREGFRSLRAIPPEALAAPVPSPNELLTTLSLHPRTQNCLMRFVARGQDHGPWSVGRLLSIRGFGLQALKDTLDAAHRAARDVARSSPRLFLEDEIEPLLNARPHLVPTVSLTLLERALRLVESILPATEDEIVRRLRDAELARGSFTLVELERAARHVTTEVSFGVLRRNDMALVLPRDQIALSQRIYVMAARVVRRWGAVSVGWLQRQLATADTDLVRAVVAARRDFRWLDRRHGWFWFGPAGSRLAAAIEKLVTTPLSLESLRLALSGDRDTELVPPVSALGALCAQLPLLRVGRDRVWPVTARPGLRIAGA